MKTKKVLAGSLSLLMLLGVSSVSAEWNRVGYDTTDLDDIGVLYNEMIDGHFTNNIKKESLPAESINWIQEGYEMNYPHAGYDRLYLEGNAQSITRFNNLFPQWETRFVDFMWEVYGNHKIYQRQQTNIPGVGWRWDFGESREIDDSLLVPTNRYASVEDSFRLYGIGPFDLNGNYVSDEVAAMYDAFGVNDPVYSFNPETKEVEENTFFHHANLSAKDTNGHYIISDDEIAAMAGVIQSKFVTGPSLYNDNPTKDVAAMYLENKDRGWAWDEDTLRYGGGQVSWSGVFYEMEEPYAQFQYLIVNGLPFDGRNDLPRIYRYTGGTASPKIEWKYAFAEADYPYNVIEFKYIDGKQAFEKDGVTPVYRIPTGEFANTYAKVTDKEVQIWLKDNRGDVMLYSESRVNHDTGYYEGYVGAGSFINN